MPIYILSLMLPSNNYRDQTLPIGQFGVLHGETRSDERDTDLFF